MIRSLALASVLAGLIGLGAAQGAAAAPLTDGGVTAQEVAAVLQAKGYRAEIGKDNDGDPKVHSGAQGVGFDIYFYGCHKGPRCSSIQFTAGFHVEGGMTLERINQWNRNNRFGRAYLDDVNDPFIEMDLDVEHGFTSEAVDNNVDTWDAVLGAFVRVVTCARHPGSDACKSQT
jgi:hypothetical protein